MKLIYSNFRKGEVKIMAENLDDLWYLSSIVDEGNLIKGSTLRKIKVGSSENQNSVKKQVFMEIKVRKTEFSKNSPALRVTGIIIQAPEDIPLGEHHTFNVEAGTEITIIKEKWLKYQLKKLNEACSNKESPLLICVLDREEVYFAIIKKYGYEVLAHIKGDVRKKGDEAKPKSDFYSLIAKQLLEYDSRYLLKQIIVASPAFWKDDFMKVVSGSDIKKKIITAACSSVSTNGIDEVIKRPEVKEALKRERASEEMHLVEKLLLEISKSGQAVYGMEESDNAASLGAVSELLVTDSLIQKSRNEGTYQRIENIMRKTEEINGSITIISSEHEGGKRLDGLGGIAALLRYKMRY